MTETQHSAGVKTMSTIETPRVSWSARGLLFENCSCQVVCPGHMHFNQLCTHDRCVGYWALRFDEGSFDGVPLHGLNAVVAYDTPQHMIAGNWIEVILIDEAASADQRRALESILTGRAGGPWAVLSRFVGRWLDTRYLPIHIVDEDAAKRVTIEGLLDGLVTNIRGRDRTQPVTFHNIFNQIHGSPQVIATGTTRYNDGTIVVNTKGTHGLHSRFDWVVTPSS